MPFDNVRSDLVNAFYDNSPLLDISLQIDQFFEDVAFLYVYDNWFDGEIVAGPSVSKYWVSVILLFPYKKMPDPEGGKVLIKLGCKVFYKKFKKKVPVDVKSPGDLDARHRPKMQEEPVWLVKVIVPRKFLKDKTRNDLELLDDELEIEDVEDIVNSVPDPTKETDEVTED